MAYAAPLIQTKLNRPPLPVDLVPRPRLTEWLEQRWDRPLTLVSAPAGYGKSTLISCWLENVDRPTAWVSLDEHDNELGSFLSYFLAAILTIFPSALPESQSLLNTPSLPPISAIAKNLINELDRINKPFTLVLDDYYRIESQAIHDLLNELLLHSPRNMHLVLGTRMDPPLPLVTLRASGQLTEIRSQDLRFNQDETLRLLQKMIGLPVDQADVIEIDAQAEGWVTGLRLAALAMRHRIGIGSQPGGISAQNRYVTEYLVNEILTNLAARLSDCLLRTSILERFCVELCEVVCHQEEEPQDNGSTQPDLSGAQFLQWLQASNLFVIPLDDQHEWFRYHHVFRDFLQGELAHRLSPAEIEQLHAAAGRWYAQNGWIEEALYHLLATDDIEAATQLVAQHRHSMMNTTQWPRLERWLNLFPIETVETSPELWILKTWLVYHRGQWSDLPALLQHLEAITAQIPDWEIDHNLLGEISTLRSLILYFAGDAEGAITQARRALKNLAPELWIVRVLARMYLSGSLLLSGDENGSYQTFYGSLEEEKFQNKRFSATLLMTACNIHWVTADLQSMARAAKRCIALCQEIDFQEILGYGNYQLGRVLYHQNSLVAAEELFARVVARPYQNYGMCYTNSACGLAMTYQALGRESEAREVTEGAIAFLLETGNNTQLPLVLASQAELALRQGSLSIASQWSKKLEPVPPLAPMPWFLTPHLILVKVWLAQNTSTSLAKAAELLNQLGEYLADIHNTRFLIETLALQALLKQALDDQPAALIVLEKALRLAQPGGFIRLFVDLGAQMAVLLSRLHLDRELDVYIDQIQSAFPGTQEKTRSMSHGELLEPLTNREFQILELLGNRLTNKEIAAQLVISPGTVKGHTINIYQKLEVNDRRQAVEKAINLGILSPK